MKKLYILTLSLLLSIQPLFAAMTGGGVPLVPQVAILAQTRQVAIVQKKIRRTKSLIRLKAYMD